MKKQNKTKQIKTKNKNRLEKDLPRIRSGAPEG